MQIRSNKFSRGTRKHLEVPKGIHRRIDVPILSIEAASRSRFREGASALTTAKEKRAVDFVSQGLLTEANRELARFINDVRTRPRDQGRDELRRRYVNEIVERAIHFAEKQNKLQARLGDLALKDDLTDCYNRRGFQVLAERQMKLGRRSGRSMLLFFIDVDGLKEINDTFGHREGDLALKRVVESLRVTFRDSDIIGRIGGDEFAILAVEAAGHCEATIRARLSECLKRANTETRQYRLSVSVGAARFDCLKASSFTDLMEQADKSMYKEKKTRQGLRMAVGAS
jgi:diguanylate cyclase (GGDEF)-like protein